MYLEARDLVGAPEQSVYILRNGFAGWQQKYGSDANITANYDAEGWSQGYY